MYINHPVKILFSKFHQKFPCESGAGFTIVELIITIAILSTGIVAIYGAYYPTFNAVASTGPRFTANYLAVEGHEIMKNIRDTNFLNGRAWNTGITDVPSGTTTFCDDINGGCQVDYTTITTPASYADSVLRLDSSGDGFYLYTGATPTVFKRKITTSSPATNVVKVTVRVEWLYKTQTYFITQDQYLYNYN